MINELYSAYKGLEDIGEKLDVKHNDIASPGMGTTFRVCLNENGDVESVDHLTKDKIKDTWSVGKGNHNQFPAVKCDFPFIPSGHESYKKWKADNKNPKIGNYQELFCNVLAEHSVDIPKMKCWPKYREKIIIREESLRDALIHTDDGLKIHELFRRYIKAENEGKSILLQVCERLQAIITFGSDKEAVKAAISAMFGDSFDKIKKKLSEPARFTLLLDCLPQNEIDIYTSSRRWVPALSEALFASEEKSGQNNGICSVTGELSGLCVGKFPSEKLNVIGNTPLFARPDDTSGPTVKRYGKGGTGSFLLSREVSENLAATIAFLSSDDLENTTWKKIPSSTNSSPSLMLAFCKSELNLAITPAIAGGIIDDFDDYESATETVLALFDKSDCTPDDVVEICEIRVIDKANRKVNYSTASSLGKISVAAREWVEASKNIPELKLLAKINRESKLLSPWSIAPIEVIGLTKNKYIRNGLESYQVHGLSFAGLMTLFLSQASTAATLAERTVVRLVNQTEPLFQYCALSRNQWQLPKKSQRFVTKADKNSEVLRLTTLLGILLFKNGKKKEVYMKSFAYQLGQLCSAMDELHIGYCQKMRSGDIPSTLIGNATYSVALQNPVKALALLAARIKPYEAWAKGMRAKYKQKTESGEKEKTDKVVLAGLGASAWIRDNSVALADHFSNDSKQVGDTFKAELMLGYLAGRPYNPKNDKSSRVVGEQI